jgi:peptidoglycan/LPS O-acetylase OafA/YrhL
MWVMLSHAGAVKGGGHAVAVFFVLSGYLIGGQLAKEKRQAGKIRLSEFYFKRITRIWLPYYIVLAGMIVLFVARRQDSVSGFYERAFGALTYTYNLVNDVRGNIHPIWVSFNQIWSLSIEEQFYLVVPLLVGWLPGRLILPVSLLLIVLFLFALPLYAGLAVGVFLAAAIGHAPAGQPLPRAALTFGVASLGVFGLLFAIGQTQLPQASCITYSLSGLVVLLAARVALPHRIHRATRYLGLMTYSYYLMHGVPVYFIGAAYRHLSASAHDPVWLRVSCGLLALPLSFLFVRYIEIPSLRIRGEAIKGKSVWVRCSPWFAWGLNLVGVIGLAYLARH